MLEEKVITIDSNLSVSYIDNNKLDKKNILFVHGWGADRLNLKGIYSFLDENYRVIAPDLPGFGESFIPDKCWGVEDYSGFIKKFLERLQISKICYVGHSFGGKIGIFLSSGKDSPVEKLVLIDSAGLRNKRKINWYFKVYFFKLLKFIVMKIFRNEYLSSILKESFGSADYKNAGRMRDIMVKSVNEDLTALLDKITCPVFLYWGQKDKDTPVWMAHKMKRLIKDSALYIVKNGTHFSFLEDNRIIDIIKSFY